MVRVFHRINNNLYNVTIQPYLNECSTSMNASVLNQIFHNPQVFPYLNWLEAVGNSAKIFVPTLSVCLMDYLLFRIKEIDYPNKQKLCLFLISTTLLCITIITTATVPYLFIISTALYIISISLYFASLVRFSNRFKHALFQKALQCLIQNGTNIREMRQYEYFKYSMNIICIGFFFAVVGTSLLQFECVLVSGVFFAKCYFPFNFLPTLTFLVQSEYATHIFFQTMFIVTIISECIMSIGLLFWLLPFVAITANIWIIQIYSHTHKAPKIKYTTANPLQKPLIFSH